MSQRWRGALPAAAPVLLILLRGHAHAQLLDRYYPANVPAYQDWFAGLDLAHLDDGYSPLGVRAGNFIIRPNVAEGAGYDSNLSGTENGRGSSLLQSSAAVSADSDWSRDGVNAAFSVDDLRYLDDPRQSYTTWTASAGGVLQYADDVIRAGYAHLNTVSLPTDVGTFGLHGPVIDEVDDLRVSDTIGVGPLVVVPSLIGQLYRFTPGSGTPAADLGQLFDRDAVTGSVTAGYEFSGGHNIIVIASDSHVAYQSAGVTQQTPPDYDDVSILAGLEYRQSALLAYRALVGWERRFPEGSGPHGQTLSAPTAELDVLYAPSRLTKITARVTQSLQDEPTGITQGLTLTTGELVLDYAIRRDVSLQASARYDYAHFPGGGATQSAISASASANWSLTRSLQLSVRYDYVKSNDSADSSLSFARNQVVLQARFQL